MLFACLPPVQDVMSDGPMVWQVGLHVLKRQAGWSTRCRLLPPHMLINLAFRFILAQHVVITLCLMCGVHIKDVISLCLFSGYRKRVIALRGDFALLHADRWRCSGATSLARLATGLIRVQPKPRQLAPTCQDDGWEARRLWWQVQSMTAGQSSPVLYLLK